MRALMTALVVTIAGSGWAADVTVKEGDVLTLDGKEYRLDGIDAPELDQLCLDEKGAVWTCGIEARQRLAALLDKRAVRCDDKGPDWIYRRRRVGICWVEGESTSLNQRLVRDGWALNFEPYAKGRFSADQADARKEDRGLWKGCFAAPRDLRRWRKQRATLLGSSCAGANKARNRLFSSDPARPPGCSIKGKIAWPARITGHRGVYHTEGCRIYAKTKPNRWFCSEEEAKTQGFRKSYMC
jgi:endonuclease YncB( thermonuclease family)